MQKVIKAYFTDSIQTQITATESAIEHIAKAAAISIKTLLNGGTIFCCGNGSSAAHAQSFVAKLVNRCSIDRPSLPAVALSADNIIITSLIDDNCSEQIYARQLNALVRVNDILLVISHHGNNQSIIRVVETAVRKDLSVIMLTGDSGGELSGLLGLNDVEIRVPSQQNSCIEETHVLMLNCLFHLIEQSLFPQNHDVL